MIMGERFVRERAYAQYAQKSQERGDMNGKLALTKHKRIAASTVLSTQTKQSSPTHPLNLGLGVGSALPLRRLDTSHRHRHRRRLGRGRRHRRRRGGRGTTTTTTASLTVTAAALLAPVRRRLPRRNRGCSGLSIMQVLKLLLPKQHSRLPTGDETKGGKVRCTTGSLQRKTPAASHATREQPTR